MNDQISEDKLDVQSKSIWSKKIILLITIAIISMSYAYYKFIYQQTSDYSKKDATDLAVQALPIDMKINLQMKPSEEPPRALQKCLFSIKMNSQLLS